MDVVILAHFLNFVNRRLVKRKKQHDGCF